MKQFSFRFSGLLYTGFLLSALTLFLGFAHGESAPILYVDNTNPCPGNGSSSSPYCSLQNAVDAAQAGDTIRIRTGTGSYNEGVETSAGRDGTESNPIIIESDTGHNPIISTDSSSFAALNLNDVSYWTIRNLTFDACSIPLSASYAIYVGANERSLTGITITGNTFRCWGGTDQGAPDGLGTAVRGSDIRLSGHYIYNDTQTANYITANVSNNIFTDSKMTAIDVVHNNGSVIENNDISGVRCGVWDYTIQSGITVGAWGKNNIFRNNKIHDWQKESDCYKALHARTAEGAVGAGIYCDVVNNNDIVENNLIYNWEGNDDSSRGSRGLGLFWEAGCSGVTMRNNVIHNIFTDQGGGINIGTGSCDGNYNNKILNNTVYNTGVYGFVFWSHSQNTVVKNNIFAVPNNVPAMYVENETVNCGGNEFDGNLYYNIDGGDPKLHWGTAGDIFDLSAWKSACDCDQNSISTDPRFVDTGSGDLTLQSSSPAIDAGVNVGLPYNGSTIDIGAKEYGGSTPTPTPDPVPTPTPAPTPAPTSSPVTASVIPGRIEAEDYDNGGEGTSYHDTSPSNFGGAGTRNDDVDIKDVANEKLTIGFTDSGEWLTYSANVKTSGSYATSFRVANGGENNSSMHLEVDGVNLGSMTIPPTGNWDTQTTLQGPTISLSAGMHTLKLVIDTPYVDINWFEFQAASPTPTPATTTPISAQKFQVGDRVKITSNSNVRACPATSCTSLRNAKTGELGTVMSGPTKADDNTWWQINFDKRRDGWTIESVLTK